jgi:hypothetical protein
MAKYKPPLVIIAPKGEDYSSIDDEEFDVIKANFKAFTEITFKQYCDWAHIGNTVIGKSVRTGIAPYDISATLKRYKSRMSNFDDGGNYFPQGVGEDVPLDFNSFYAGHFSAGCPKGSGGSNFFHVSGQDLVNSKFVNSGSFIISNETYFIDNGISDVQPFYHRDKFYLVWRFKPSWGNASTTFSFTATPTLLSWTETNLRFNGTVSYTRTYSYELQPNS